MTSGPAQVETSPESPATVPTVQGRAGQLAALGWTGREAEWLALVALHSGVFTRSQWRHFFNDPHREMVSRFVRALVEKKLAIEDERAIFPDGARAVLLTGKTLYRALGIPDVRHRRGKDATTQLLMRRLLSLDYLIERPSLGASDGSPLRMKRCSGSRMKRCSGSRRSASTAPCCRTGNMARGRRGSPAILP